MYVKGTLVDMTTKTVKPNEHQNFDAFETVHLLIKEHPEYDPLKVIADPKDINGMKVGDKVEIPVWLKSFITGPPESKKNCKANYNIRLQGKK